MLTIIIVFVAGIVEYLLAVYWTQTVVAKHVKRAAAITFLNVMLWGFVVMNLRLGDPILLIVHAIGCAIGSAIACAYLTEPNSVDEV